MDDTSLEYMNYPPILISAKEFCDYLKSIKNFEFLRKFANRTFKDAENLLKFEENNFQHICISVLFYISSYSFYCLNDNAKNTLW